MYELSLWMNLIMKNEIIWMAINIKAITIDIPIAKALSIWLLLSAETWDRAPTNKTANKK